MGLKGFRFDFRFLEKLVGVTVVLCVVGLFIAMFLHAIYGDVLFIEGMVVFAAGASVAAGLSNIKRERLATLMTDPDGLREFLEQQRAAQLSEGIWITVVGAIITVISIMTFFV